MATFLERYLAGEHEAVWAELAALGPRVRDQPVVADAWAVARETMQRARANVDLIIERLDSMGYQFWDGVQGPKPPPGKRIASPPLRAVTFGERRLEAASGVSLLAGMFAEAQGLPAEAVTPVMAGQLHLIYRDAVWPWQDTSQLARGLRHPADAAAVALYEQAKRAPPTQVAILLPELERLSTIAIEQLRGDWEAREAARPPPAPVVVDHRKDRIVRSPPRKKNAALLARLEKRGLHLPLALGAWIEAVGDVCLAGSHPGLAFWEDATFPGVHADPLMLAIDLAEIDAWQSERQPGPLSLVVGWDARTKSRLTIDDVELDFGYTVALPDAGADPRLNGVATPTTFVGHLRRAFAFGGFPGWADQPTRPDAELQRLTEGLEPI